MAGDVGGLVRKVTGLATESRPVFRWEMPPEAIEVGRVWVRSERLDRLEDAADRGVGLGQLVGRGVLEPV